MAATTTTNISRLFYHKCKSGLNFMFRKHLLLTNLTISTSLSATGDILQQHYELSKSTNANTSNNSSTSSSSSRSSSSNRAFNYKRTFHMWVTGGPVGFVCHHWYNLLDKYVPGRSLGIVLKKVILDQCLCSPLVISTFFITLALLEKKSILDFWKDLKNKSWRLYLAEWIIWPPAQVINFYVLPTRYRVLYDNTISLGYDVYTSYVVHDDEEDEVEVEEKVEEEDL